MRPPVIGFALCGSFCTFDQVIKVLKRVAGEYHVIPIMSPNSASIDTRFGCAGEFVKEIERICGRPVITKIEETEPIGPQKLLDLLVIAPCTGNTTAKIANGITDTGVTMAYKAHMRNQRPVLLAISTNDALSANAPNIGILLNRKHNYFVPFYQDDPFQKPTSLTADFEMIPEAIEAALQGRQLQPVVRCAPEITYK